MKYIKTKYKHYEIYIKENNTERLERGLKIYTNTKSGLINEIFNDFIKTDYKIEEISGENILISFYSKSKNKYRIDLMNIYESDKSPNLVTHISFSDYNRDIKDLDYEELLNRNEMLDVLGRIHYIMIDLVNKGHINNYFCIGGTELSSKNKIYKYALQVIVGDDGFKKLKTKLYDSGYGLYFSINI